MVRGKKPLHSPSASWVCSVRYLARGERRGRAPAAAHVYPRNCPTFSAAPHIRVSLDTRCVKFASVIMSEEGESVESAGVVERRKSSEAVP